MIISLLGHEINIYVNITVTIKDAANTFIFVKKDKRDIPYLNFLYAIIQFL